MMGKIYKHVKTQTSNKCVTAGPLVVGFASFTLLALNIICSGLDTLSRSKS